MSNVRLRRLQADHQNLVEYVRQHPRLRLIQAAGDPPERYQLEFRIKSLRQVDNDLQEIKSHLVEISLPRNYPRTPPLCRMLTPVFHPNIAPHAICVGDHWSAGEPLKSIVARIGEMLAFQSYNVKSPLNGEAARWVEENLDRLPLDNVSLLVEESAADNHADENQPVAPVVRQPAVKIPSSPPVNETPSSVAEEIVFEEAPPEPEKVRIRCPNCSAKFQALTTHLGKKARCSKCQLVFVLSRDHQDP
jgi:ubiquitin-protein ligase